jgi:hypothetical protein
MAYYQWKQQHINQQNELIKSLKEQISHLEGSTNQEDRISKTTEVFPAISFLRLKSSIVTFHVS